MKFDKNNLTNATQIDRIYEQSKKRRANKYSERYRSGHNGPDSKSGSPQGLVGSNPTRSAKSTQFEPKRLITGAFSVCAVFAEFG